MMSSRMGICWSEPPVQQTTVIRTYQPTQTCRQCGSWVNQANIDICEGCLQKNAMKVITPQQQQYQYQQQYPQYTYAVQYPQPQMYSYAQTYPPQQQYYPPQQYPQQQQRQMGPVGAMATGFVVGALMEDILDPME